MAVFCISLTSWFPVMSLTYFLNDLEMIPVAPIITVITLVFYIPHALYFYYYYYYYYYYIYMSLRNFITLANTFCNFLNCIPTNSRGKEGVASYSETLYIRAYSVHRNAIYLRASTKCLVGRGMQKDEHILAGERAEKRKSISSALRALRLVLLE
jgi:hypothetical protein